MPGTVDRYQLLDTIGTGTLGVLHRARDLQKGRTVALRLVTDALARDAATAAALADAARRASELSHPGVAALYEWGTSDGVLFLVSEYVPGQSLAAMVSGAALHPARAVDLAVQLADALAAAEQHGLEHGALTTSAVFITPKGVAKLLDIGFRDWTRAASQPAVPDAAALAAVLFEMLAGRPLRPGWPAEFRLPAVPAPLQPLLARMGASRAGEAMSMVVVAAELRGVAEQRDAGRPDAGAMARVAPRAPARAETPAADAPSKTPWLLGLLVLVAALAFAAWRLARG